MSPSSDAFVCFFSLACLVYVLMHPSMALLFRFPDHTFSFQLLQAASLFYLCKLDPQSVHAIFLCPFLIKPLTSHRFCSLRRSFIYSFSWLRACRAHPCPSIPSQMSFVRPCRLSASMHLSICIFSLFSVSLDSSQLSMVANISCNYGVLGLVVVARL